MRTAADFTRLETALTGGEGPVAAFSVPEQAKAHMLATLSTRRTVLAVTGTDAAAVKLSADVRGLGARSAAFLSREMPLVHVCAFSTERTGSRIDALTRLLNGERCVIAASASAVLQALCPPENFIEAGTSLRTGDEIAPRALVEKLVQAGYERVEMVEGRGQISLRGDLVDVYAPNALHPVRVEFFGDEIDQMRTFDETTQRSLEQVTYALFPPALETPQTRRERLRGLSATLGAVGFDEQREAWEQDLSTSGADALIPALFDTTATVTDYLRKDGVIAVLEPARVEESMAEAALLFSEQVRAMLERGEGLSVQGKLMQSAAEGLPRLNTKRTLALYTLTRTHPAFPPREVASLPAQSTPQYVGGMGELARDLSYFMKNGERMLLFAGERAEVLADALSAEGQELPVMQEARALPESGRAAIVSAPLPFGFRYPGIRVTVLSEQEIFGKPEGVKRQGGRKRGTLHFSELSVGDYVVHEVHGIGRFTGVEQLTVDGNTKDYLLLEYRGGDKLYIPTDQMDRIEKYVGGGDEDYIPSVSKLGGTDWQSRVSKAKASAKKLAVDLAALYAERSAGNGFASLPDTPWQKQFEDSFPYRETPDQLQSILEIKKDMESKRPMDRLLCGDVGYGKTEVALRAAFKAIQSGKQAAILVPTTILAEQHYATAMGRLRDFPVKIRCLSRFRTNAEKEQIKKDVAAGRIDLVIGTHALLAHDVRFCDLGLLIIDEEHRFGVNHKEQIKALKKSVDVLTLSATPIPRTLNMSMTGVRDISVIETPPEERFPVQTFVLEYTDALLSEVVSRELARGGQTYVVYNRVQTIEQFARRISSLVPDARVLVAHGQMGETALEKAMMSFCAGEADVLLCSTIIESGLDIPNANTLVVVDADRMGLAQLYQLRGRVGRSARLGYAYFTVRKDMVLPEKAAKRLMAIREFTRFGAGFQIAMRDLEIRGAGSLLGAEQHGHIADIGYEYYCKLMQSAVREARGEAPAIDVDTTIDIPVDAHIPKEYIGSELQRLSVYRRIADISTFEERDDMADELTDRYGEPPKPVQNLLSCQLVKAFGQKSRLSSVTVREGLAKLLFDASASLDGGRLIGILSANEGAQLLSTNPPGIVIKLPKRSAEGIVKKLVDFLPALAECTVSAEE